MNWKNLIAKTSMSAALVTFGLSTIAAPAQAGWSLSDLDPTNKNSGIRQLGRDIDPTNPNGRILGEDLHAKFSICNRTNGTVNYSINNRNSSLRKGHCEKWTTTGQALIKFDQTFAHGYQAGSYTLNDGKYHFKNVDWSRQTNAGRMALGRGIDLRKD